MAAAHQGSHDAVRQLKKAQIEACCGSEARYDVASNVVRQVSLRLRQPLSLDATNFERHYETRLALPYPVLTNLNPAQIALFEEQSTSPMGVDLEVQSTRFYPYGTTAAHVLGHLQRDDSSMEGEEAFFSFRPPDYRGMRRGRVRFRQSAARYGGRQVGVGEQCRLPPNREHLEPGRTRVECGADD